VLRNRPVTLGLILLVSAFSSLSTALESFGITRQDSTATASSFLEYQCPTPSGLSEDGVAVSRGDKTGPYVGFNVSAGYCPGSETALTSSPSRDETTGTATSGAPDLDTTDQISIGSGECQWKYVEPPPAAGDPRWAGNDPSTGSVITNSCNGPIEYRFLPGPNPAAPPPPPDPAVLAQQAYSELVIPQPAIGAGPDRTKLAVSLWTWLWVDNPGQLSVTVAAGGVSVTATATLATVSWTLGEPATQSDTYQPGSPATITCQGAGTAPPASYDWKAQPPCGYKYHWRSLKERTGGTGTWPITATTNWTVTWQSNTGVTGGTTLNATSNDQFDIGEYRTVLVQGGDGG